MKARPSGVDPKQLFKQQIFGPVYENFKASVVHEDPNTGEKSYDIPPMKLAEIFNKAMHRFYELLVFDVVCAQMLGQPLIQIPSRIARQKFLRKYITKSNRDEAKDRVIGVILEIIHDNNKENAAQGICDTIIADIAQRVANGEPEPDEDGFEGLFNSLISATSSPAASPPPRTPGHVPLPPSPPSSDDSFL